MENYLPKSDEIHQETFLRVSRTRLADFRKLLEKCSRVPSRFGIYHIGRLWIAAMMGGVGVFLVKQNTRRLSCRIKPEFYEKVYSHLGVILRDSRCQGENHGWILEYLKGLRDAQESQGTKQPDMELAQTHDLSLQAVSVHDIEPGQSLCTLSIEDSIS